MRRFHLLRSIDESGISGTGRVAEGVQFSDGRCVMVWLRSGESMGFYRDINTLLAVHGHGGKTTAVFVDA